MFAPRNINITDAMFAHFKSYCVYYARIFSKQNSGINFGRSVCIAASLPPCKIYVIYLWRVSRVLSYLSCVPFTRFCRLFSPDLFLRGFPLSTSTKILVFGTPPPPLVRTFAVLFVGKIG